MDSTTRDEPDVTVEQLRKWFAHKGLVNVVLRLEDVEQLQPYMRTALGLIVGRLGTYRLLASDGGGVRQEFPDVGHLVLPIDKLTDGRFNLAELGLLQEIVACYREVRRGNGYPMREEPCPCGGGDKNCRMCDGDGVTRTLTEMSEEEAALAYEREEREAKA